LGWVCASHEGAFGFESEPAAGTRVTVELPLL